MRKIFRYFRDRRFEYEPLVSVSIYKDRLLHNFNQYKNTFGKKGVAPVLKSNAYGHGLVQIAKILDGECVPFFVVDSYHEALILRNEGIKTKILVMGFALTPNIFKSYFKNVSFTIGDMLVLKKIAHELTSPQKFHIKIDIGMHRQGIMKEDISEAITLIKSNPNIEIEGVCSHFSDPVNKSFTEKQIIIWNKSVEDFKTEFSEISYFHISATEGYSYRGSVSANCMRLGLGLYGIGEKELSLLPTIEVSTSVTGIKKIPVGEVVGYGSTFKTEKDTTLGIVPAGYYEGVDRRLSNKGFFKIGNFFVQIAGRISMNISTFNALDVSLEIGQKIILISSNPEDKNSVENIAKMCDTIPYEILVHINPQLRRTLA